MSKVRICEKEKDWQVILVIEREKSEQELKLENLKLDGELEKNGVRGKKNAA